MARQPPQPPRHPLVLNRRLSQPAGEVRIVAGVGPLARRLRELRVIFGVADCFHRPAELLMSCELVKTRFTRTALPPKTTWRSLWPSA